MNLNKEPKAVYSIRLPEEEKAFIDDLAYREQRNTSNTLLILLKESINARKIKEVANGAG